MQGQCESCASPFTYSFSSHYEMGEVLGQGAFGTVNLAKTAGSSLEYAIKCIDKKKAGILHTSSSVLVN